MSDLSQWLRLHAECAEGDGCPEEAAMLRECAEALSPVRTLERAALIINRLPLEQSLVVSRWVEQAAEFWKGMEEQS